MFNVSLFVAVIFFRFKLIALKKNNTNNITIALFCFFYIFTSFFNACIINTDIINTI